MATIAKCMLEEFREAEGVDGELDVLKFAMDAAQFSVPVSVGFLLAFKDRSVLVLGNGGMSAATLENEFEWERFLLAIIHSLSVQLAKRVSKEAAHEEAKTWREILEGVDDSIKVVFERPA